MIEVEVYEVTLVRKRVSVPDTCPKCGNAFNVPGESSLLSTRIEGEGYWSYIDHGGRRPVLCEGERHHPAGFGGQYRIGLTCGECQHEIAAPIVTERAS